MFSSNINMQSIVSNFHLDHMMRYSLFVPRLYNLCRSPGFEAGNIIPSRAFCSDENQGFPIILIANHFGAFPFNHGRVGGMTRMRILARIWRSSRPVTPDTTRKPMGWTPFLC